MLSKTNRSYLNVARYFATKSSSRNTHGAVIVKSGRVVATGWNKDRNHPTNVSPENIKTDCSFHAEEVAIRVAGEDNVRGAVIYVARVNKNGYDRDSKPCSKCASLIEKVGIKRVIFTMEAGEINYASN
jgi:deoxycytidylate deaminase